MVIQQGATNPFTPKSSGGAGVGSGQGTSSKNNPGSGTGYYTSGGGWVDVGQGKSYAVPPKSTGGNKGGGSSFQGGSAPKSVAETNQENINNLKTKDTGFVIPVLPNAQRDLAIAIAGATRMDMIQPKSIESPYATINQPTLENAKPKGLWENIKEQYYATKLAIPFLAKKVPVTNAENIARNEKNIPGFIGSVTGVDINKLSGEDRIRLIREAKLEGQLTEEYQNKIIKQANDLVQIGAITQDRANQMIAGAGIKVPTSEDFDKAKVVRGHDTMGNTVYYEKNYGELKNEQKKDYESKVSSIQSDIDNQKISYDEGKLKADNAYNEYISNVKSIPAPELNYGIRSIKPETLYQYQYKTADTKFGKTMFALASGTQSAAEAYYGTKLIDVAAFQPIGRGISALQGVYNTGKGTAITLKSLGYVGGAGLIGYGGYSEYKKIQASPSELKGLEVADVIGSVTGATAFFGEKNMLPIRGGAIARNEVGELTKGSLYFKVPFKDKIYPLITYSKDLPKVISLSSGKELTYQEIAGVPFGIKPKTTFELGYGKKGIPIEASMEDLTTRGFQPANEAQLAYEKKFLTNRLSPELKALRNEQIKVNKLLYNTPQKDIGTWATENSKSLMAEGMTPEARAFLIEDLKKAGGSKFKQVTDAILNRGVERYYGSITIDAEGGFKYNVARKTPEGIIETGDVDIQRRKDAIKEAERLYKELSSRGANVKWEKDTGLIQVKTKLGEYVNLLDIHGPDLPDLNIGEMPLGFKSQPTTPTKIGNVKVPTQRITESTVQKLAGVLEYRRASLTGDLFTGELTFQPREGQEKAITDYPSMLKSIGDRANPFKQEQANKAVENYLKLQKTRYPEMKFDLSKPVTFNVEPIKVTAKPNAVSTALSKSISDTIKASEKSPSVKSSSFKSSSLKPISLASLSKSPYKSPSLSSSLKSLSKSPSMFSLSPSPSASGSPSFSPSRSPSPSKSPSFSPSPYSPFSPPSLPSWGSSGSGSKSFKSFFPSAKKMSSGYTASLGAAAFQTKPFKVTRKQYEKLNATTFSGLEARPVLTITDDQKKIKKILSKVKF